MSTHRTRSACTLLCIPRVHTVYNLYGDSENGHAHSVSMYTQLNVHPEIMSNAMWFSYINGHISATALLSRAADTSMSDDEDLVYACQFGNTHDVSRLIAAGANVNVHGSQPLVYACANRRRDIVILLIAIGAYIPRYLLSDTAKHSLDITRVLVAAGCDIHYDKERALCAAVAYGRTDTVNFLLASGANVHVAITRCTREPLTANLLRKLLK